MLIEETDEPVWIHNEKLKWFVLLWPVVGSVVATHDSTKIARATDKQGDIYLFSFIKFTKENLMKKVNVEFKQKHDFVIARFFKEVDGEIVPFEVEDHEDQVTVYLKPLPGKNNQEN